MGKDHKLGPPFIHAFAQLLRMVIEDKRNQDERPALEQYWTGTILRLGLDEVAMEVRYCRLSRCKGQEEPDDKLQYHVRDLNLDKLLYRCLERMGGIKKIGPPPRSELRLLGRDG